VLFFTLFSLAPTSFSPNQMPLVFLTTFSVHFFSPLVSFLFPPLSIPPCPTLINPFLPLHSDIPPPLQYASYRPPSFSHLLWPSDALAPFFHPFFFFHQRNPSIFILRLSFCVSLFPGPMPHFTPTGPARSSFCVLPILFQVGAVWVLSSFACCLRRVRWPFFPCLACCSGSVASIFSVFLFSLLSPC